MVEPRVMDANIDRAASFIADQFARYRVSTPSVSVLGRARTEAAHQTLERFRPRALELAAAMDDGEPGAAEAYGAHVERALAHMRQAVDETAASALQRWAARAHRVFGDTDEAEYLDDPDFDPVMRVQMLEDLDAINTTVGNYRSFFAQMEPLLVLGRPTRVLDLAAGHGGFALEVARIAGSLGIEVEMTATDLRAEYLALGEATARNEGLKVHFKVQDALDLSNLEPGAYDIVVCTQSIHHFPASMTARMFREASKAAGRGVVFIDGCRSMLLGAVIRSFGLLRYRNPGLAHDAWVSFRRFYSPEELGLIAQLGPEGPRVEATWMPPAHCLLRYRS